MLLSKGGLVGSTDRALMPPARRLSDGARRRCAVLMALFAFIPGLPFVPFMIGAGCLGGAAWLARQTQAARGGEGRRRRPAAAAPPKKSLGDLLDVDEIHMEFAPNLVPVVMDEATGLDARIAQHAQPHRHRVRADPAGDPADRQSGAAAGHLRDPGAGGRGGAERHRDRPGAGAAARRGRAGAGGARRWPSRSTARRRAGSRRRCRRRRR